MLHVHVSFRRNKIVCCHSAVFVVWLGLSTETTTETCSKDIQGWKDARIKVFVSVLDGWHPSRFLQYNFRQLFSFRYRRLKNFMWFNIFQQKLQVGFKPRASTSAACMRRSLYQESYFFYTASCFGDQHQQHLMKVGYRLFTCPLNLISSVNKS